MARDINGSQAGTVGYNEASNYFTDPLNNLVANSHYQEHDIGVTSFMLEKVKENLDFLLLISSTGNDKEIIFQDGGSTLAGNTNLLFDKNTNTFTSANGVFTGTLNATGNATLGGILGVSGNATLGGTLNVTGDVILSSNLTVNGTTTTVNTQNLLVTDKLITLNNNGLAGTGGVSGIEIEENALITGYIKTSADRNNWNFKVPNNASIVSLRPLATSFISMSGNLTVESASFINQDVTTNANVSFSDVNATIGAVTPNTGRFTTLQLPFGSIPNEFSTDGTLIGNSDIAIPTEQAVKTYIGAPLMPIRFQTGSYLDFSNSTTGGLSTEKWIGRGGAFGGGSNTLAIYGQGGANGGIEIGIANAGIITINPLNFVTNFTGDVSLTGASRKLTIDATSGDPRISLQRSASELGAITLSPTNVVNILSGDASICADFQNKRIQSIADPVNSQDGATKNYVDSSSGGATTVLVSSSTTFATWFTAATYGANWTVIEMEVTSTVNDANRFSGFMYAKLIFTKGTGNTLNLSSSLYSLSGATRAPNDGGMQHPKISNNTILGVLSSSVSVGDATDLYSGVVFFQVVGNSIQVNPFLDSQSGASVINFSAQAISQVR